MGISQLGITHSGLPVASVTSQDERKEGEREMWREALEKQLDWLEWVRFLRNQTKMKV